MSSSYDYREHWISNVSPNEPYKFERRLSWSSCTESDFFNNFSSDSTYFSSSFLDSTYTNTQAIIDCLQSNWDFPLRNVEQDEQKPFVDLWLPLELLVKSVLTEEFPEISSFCSDIAIKDAARLLINRLVDLSDCILWEKYSNYRKPGSFFLAQSRSNNNQFPPRFIYQDFIFHLRSELLVELFAEYPVFKFFVGTIYSHWLSFVCELLSRLVNDQLLIQSHFSIPSSHRLFSIEGDLSDPHRNGRSVLILSFTSPTNDTSLESLKLVYKPKSIELDFKFYTFLKCINDKSSLNPFRILKILSLANYGYIEYLPSDELILAKDLPLFYAQLGQLSSLLYLLGCTDLHHENLIVSKGQLVLIDAETIFDSTLPSDNDDVISRYRPTPLEHSLFRSLLTCGLLPYWSHYGALNTPIDISAIGINSPTADTSLSAGWININSDAMRAGQILRPTRRPTTLPISIGSSNPFLLYTNSFVNGFRSQCDLLISLRPFLLSSNGPIDQFYNLQRRALIRATQVYYTLQRQQFLPKSLSSFFEQSLVLEKLSLGYLVHTTRPDNWPIFLSEVDQMMNLDIPMFDHAIGSDLFETSLGDTVSLQFPDAHASVKSRLLALDEHSINFQITLILGSFEASALHNHELLDKASFLNPQAISQSTVSSYMPSLDDIDKFILNYLNNSVFLDDHSRCQWLTFNLHPSNVFSFYINNCSLYSGISALPSFIDNFLVSSPFQPVTYSDEFSNIQKISQSSGSSLAYNLNFPDNATVLRWWRDNSLGLNGCGGHLLALSLTSANCDSFFIPEVFDVISQTTRPSLLHGSLGLIPALLSIGSTRSMELANHIGFHLSSNIVDSNFFSSSQSGYPVGFLHGASGLSAVLLRLYRSFPNDLYLHVARASLDYVMSLNDPDLGIPPIIQNSFFHETTFSVNDYKFSLDLSSGLAGVLLSRICLFDSPLWDDKCLHDLTNFITFILEHEDQLLGLNLAYGRLGPLAVIDLLLHLKIPLSIQLLDQLNGFVARQRQILSSDLMSSDPHFYPNKHLSVYPLGFFDGLLGIGHFFNQYKMPKNFFKFFFTLGLFE